MIDHIRTHTLPAAYSLLPPSLASPEATALLLAIGWQESRFQFRRQVKGPARGFWQFEQSGVDGVLAHPDTKIIIRKVLVSLGYRSEPTPVGCHYSLEHNDTLAAIFARLLLWTVPYPLPLKDEPQKGWDQYRMGWRPGKPHPETWQESWEVAWEK